MRALGRSLAILVWAGWAAWWSLSPAWAQLPLPELRARVTDLTRTLDATQVAALEAELAGLERRKGAQIAVLLLPTTRPESIEAFGIRLAESWKLGRRGIDDGVIVIVAKDDRRMRIEVGYGLEGVIPDAEAKRIVSELMGPRFREGDFYGGIQAGVRRLAGLIEGEALPARAAGRPAEDFGDEGLFGPLLFAAFFIGPVLRAIFGRLIGGLAAGALAGGVVGYLTGSLVGAIAVGAVVAIMVAAGIAFGGRGGGGWGGRGSGGFSGGGGGFGGGGASGRW